MMHKLETAERDEVAKMTPLDEAGGNKQYIPPGSN